MRPRINSKIAEELVETGTPNSFKAIDTHGHMGGFSGIAFPNPAPEQMLRTMDRCGVEWLVFSNHDALQDQEAGNLKAQEAIRAHPTRFRGYLAVNPRYPDLLRKAVERFETNSGFVGYKILAGYYEVAVTQPECGPLWKHADEARLVVLLHTWGGNKYAGCRQVREVAAKYPGATILMGHSQYGDWDKAIQLAQEYDNVYCELTAAYAANGLIKKMVDAGIEDKITFGTDLPWFDPMYGIGCVVFSQISDDARYKILRGNAERILAPWI